MKASTILALAGVFAIGASTAARAAFPTFYSNEADFHAQGVIAQSTNFDAYGPNITSLGFTAAIGDLELHGFPVLVIGTGTSFNPVRNLVDNDDASDDLTGSILKTGYNMLSFKMANLRGYGEQVFGTLHTNLASYSYGFYPDNAPESLSFYGFVVPDGEYFLGFELSNTNIDKNFEPTAVDQVFGLTDIELGATSQPCENRICAGPGAVPEPGAWALMILGFGAAGAALRTRRRPAPGLPAS